MTPRIQQPIFLVGAPRSGTSVFYRKFAQHPSLAWISNITKKYPGSLLITRMLMLFRKDHHPTEAGNVWQRFGKNEDDALRRADATPRAAKYMRKVVANNLRIFGKPRFLNKCPRNSLRIDFLDAIFPDAYFIHIIRDGRAVAHSLLRSREKHSGAYWAARPPGWKELLERPMIEACGLQWKSVVEFARRAGKSLPPDRYMEIRYEDFVARPEETFLKAGEWCGLQWDRTQLKALVSDIENRNFKWRERLNAGEIAALNSVIRDLLEELGYEV
jgi:hypothetical protein